MFPVPKLLNVYCQWYLDVTNHPVQLHQNSRKCLWPVIHGVAI